MARRRLIIAVAGLAAAMITLAPGQVGAAPVGPVNPIEGSRAFGVLVEQDAFLAGDEIEGAVAIGRDLIMGGRLSLATRTIGSFVAPGDQVPSALIVGRRVDFAESAPSPSLRVLNGGYAKVGDLTGTFVRDLDNDQAPSATRILPADDYASLPRIELAASQAPASVGPATPFDTAGLFATYRTRSAALATCPGTIVLRDGQGAPLSTPIPPGTQARITLAPGTNVLNIAAIDLDNIAVLAFANLPTATSPLLINVDTADVEGDFSWHSPEFGGIGEAQAPYVLVNFSNARNLAHDNGASIPGTVFAPGAAFVDDNPSDIEGTVVAREVRMTAGKVRQFPFEAKLRCGLPSPSPPLTSVGPPSSMIAPPSASRTESAPPGADGSADRSLVVGSDPSAGTPPATSSISVPITGTPLTLIVIGGVLLIILGLVLLYAALRRD